MTAAGIYIHIPFCRTRCSYCDFATGIYDRESAERYVSALVREIRDWNEIEPPHHVDTIYFGGGTPSLLSVSQVDQILAAVHERFKVDSETEVTMEMNPGTVTPSLAEDLLKVGVNRASFGAQSFDNRELARLGRSHNADDIRQTFRSLRAAGFANVSFDLIAGLPGQTMDRWSRNLDEALDLRPEHLSFYLLEVHEGTPLADHIRKGIQPKPDDDLAAQMYELMILRARGHGYEHYEISNLSLPGFESRHNTKYWTGLPYYGFGCSAHSYDGDFQRWSNERAVSRYTELIEEGRSAVVERVGLSEEERRSEKLFLGLRMMRGVDLENYRELCGVDLREEYKQDLARFHEAGLIEFSGDRLKLTPAGALLSNEVFSAFV
jgi:oxygen-independent coproporphyrinogen-3 oxidase